MFSGGSAINTIIINKRHLLDLQKILEQDLFVYLEKIISLEKILTTDINDFFVIDVFKVDRQVFIQDSSIQDYIIITIGDEGTSYITISGDTLSSYSYDDAIKTIKTFKSYDEMFSYIKQNFNLIGLSSPIHSTRGDTL